MLTTQKASVETVAARTNKAEKNDFMSRAAMGGILITVVMKERVPVGDRGCRAQGRAQRASDGGDTQGEQ